MLTVFGVARPQETYRGQASGLQPRADWDIKPLLRSGALVSMHSRWVKSFGGWPSSWRSKYAYATTSGITALHPALKALGVGPGDDVITTPFTFAASATVVLHADAVPTFTDIDRETLNLDSASVESKITDTTKAVVVFHLAGYPAEMDAFKKLADRYGLYITEDVAQDLGAKYRGRRASSVGHISAFSFYVTKHVTGSKGGAYPLVFFGGLYQQPFQHYGFTKFLSWFRSQCLTACMA
jgi:Predicted pyridoxal phosphate-dependent enzyme apparently involved in regulation of cell wall biogenesis